MKQITDIPTMQSLCAQLRNQGQKTGFVPTMGYLHEGHLSLVKRSKKECSVTVVSIFVNPTQFAPEEDFDRYPRDTKRDINLLEELDVDFLFIPKKEQIYPNNFLTWVIVDEITGVGEGAARPAHFQGVTTIVTKLLNIVQPSVLYLGQKDIQQAVILKKMIGDLNIPSEVRICPTIREKEGLAMSSRNAYLSVEERESALALFKALQLAELMVNKGEVDCQKISKKMKKTFDHIPGAQLDYIICMEYESFKPVKKVETRTIIALAVYIGTARLIDNVIVSPPKN